MRIHIGMLCKGIQRAVRKQLDSKGDFFRFWLVLFKQFLTEVLQGGRYALIIALLIVAVHACRTTVNNRLLFCTQTCAADELLAQRQNKLRFQNDGVCAVTVIGVHIHSIDMAFACCRDMNDLALHRLYKRRIFSLRVYNNDIGIRVCENDICHFFFCCKGFSCSRHTENKRVAVEQIAAVGNNHIFADNILPIVNAVFVMNFLHSERNKNRQTFRCKSPHCINLADAKRQGGIQPVHLLIFQYRKLTEVLSGCGKESFRIVVKLLLCFSRMHHRQNRKHHSLVTGCQIVQELLAFLALLFKVIGNDRRKIIVLILFTLPIRDIGFYTQKTVFYLTHGFVCGYGDNINGHHHIAVKLTKLRHHTILNICRILTQKNDTPISVAHTKVVLFKLESIGTDIVLKVVTLSHTQKHIKGKARFLACAVEVVENAELFFRFKLYAF